MSLQRIEVPAMDEQIVFYVLWRLVNDVIAARDLLRQIEVQRAAGVRRSQGGSKGVDTLCGIVLRNTRKALRHLRTRLLPMLENDRRGNDSHVKQDRKADDDCCDPSRPKPGDDDREDDSPQRTVQKPDRKNRQPIVHDRVDRRGEESQSERGSEKPGQGARLTERVTPS